jgi:hypothetical protein
MRLGRDWGTVENLVFDHCDVDCKDYEAVCLGGVFVLDVDEADQFEEVLHHGYIEVVFL